MTQAKQASSRPPSLSEWIAATLTKEIVLGDILPGSVLREADVAARFRTSRGPCREAFAILGRRGFLETAPYRANVIRTMAEQEIRELTQCRLLLDPACAALAATNATPEEQDRMRALANAGQTAAAAGNRGAFYDAARELREVLLTATQNRFLKDMAESISHQSDRMRLGSVETRTELMDRADRTSAIIEAMCERDAERATALMRDGIRTAESAALAARSRIEREEARLAGK